MFDIKKVEIEWGGRPLIMETGKMVMDGTPQKLLKDADVQEFYLGLRGEGEKKSFRDVKHYKRRKRWLS